jgi:hypothetical protein
VLADNPGNIYRLDAQGNLVWKVKSEHRLDYMISTKKLVAIVWVDARLCSIFHNDDGRYLQQLTLPSPPTTCRLNPVQSSLLSGHQDGMPLANNPY